MRLYNYTHNNSGGSDWLTHGDMQDLADAGFDVTVWFNGYNPVTIKAGGTVPTNSRPYMASKAAESLGDFIKQWRRATGGSPNALGCSCCGTPHYFASAEGQPYESYSPDFPMCGDDYDG